MPDQRRQMGLAEAPRRSLAVAMGRGLDLAGIGMLPETKRVYPVSGVSPETTLAAQVIGFVNVDGAGQYGMESAEDALLAGLPGSVSAQEDVIGRQIADSVYELRPPVDGSDLRLTIDAGLQHILEAAMWSTYRRNPAQGVTGLVMDVPGGGDPGDGLLPVVRRQRVRQRRSGGLHQPRGEAPVRARLGDEGLHRGSRPGCGTSSTCRRPSRTTTTCASRDVRIQNADRYTVPYGHGRDHGRRRPEALEQRRSGQDRPPAGPRAPVRGLQAASASASRPGSRSRARPRGCLEPGRAERLGRPDRRPERLRAGPVGDRHAAGGGLRCDRQRRDAGHAARARRLDHAGRRLPRGRASSRASGSCARRRRHRPAAADRRRGRRDRAQPAYIPGYSVAARPAPPRSPDRSPSASDRDRWRTASRSTRRRTHFGYINGWIDSSFISIMPASDRKSSPCS